MDRDALALANTMVGNPPGAAVLEAASNLELLARGAVTVSGNAFLYTSGDDSTIRVRGSSVALHGELRAGQDHPFAYDPARESMTFDATASPAYTGQRAQVVVQAQRDLVVGAPGNAQTGGQVFATGRIDLSAGTATSGTGTGFEMSAIAGIRVDATGAGTWAAPTVDGCVPRHRSPPPARRESRGQSQGLPWRVGPHRCPCSPRQHSARGCHTVRPRRREGTVRPPLVARDRRTPGRPGRTDALRRDPCLPRHGRAPTPIETAHRMTEREKW
jgi:hypothetical protein